MTPPSKRPMLDLATSQQAVRHQRWMTLEQRYDWFNWWRSHRLSTSLQSRKLGMNVGNFTATAPVHTHIAREPDAVARVWKLAETGHISTGSLWHTVGAVNSWQVFAAQDAIIAKAMKETATDAAAKAAADLVVITEAENLANSSTMSDPRT
jgi:hypothetical protein